MLGAEEVLVDVIFLDIDGVLLPFGGSRDGYSKDKLSFADGCIFPNCTMDALTLLLQRIYHIHPKVAPSGKRNGSSEATEIRGNPVLVLSSTWRARPEFIEDILASFRAHVVEKGLKDTSPHVTWEKHLESFFDITDPNYHATRYEEIQKWLRDNENNRQVGKINSQHTDKFILRSWIALDDEDLVNVEGTVSKDATNHAIQTKSSVGLANTDVDLGVRLVKRQIEEFHGILSS